MPQLSAFTWPGAWDMSVNPTHVEQLYNLLPTLFGSQIDFTDVGSYDETKLYAWSVVLGSALYELEHAGNQADPLKAYDLLPLLEKDFGCVPGPLDSLQTRQAAVAAAELLPLGAGPSNCVNAIKSLVMAAKFLAYVPSPAGGSPTIFGGADFAQFLDVRIPPRFVQLVDPVVTGGTTWCAYQNLDTSIATPNLLLAGDRIQITNGNGATLESTTVNAVSSTVQADCTPGYNYFNAGFEYVHEVGSAITTGNFPYWGSTQRLAYVVLAAAWALDRPTRAKVDNLLSKIARTTDQWAILQPTTTTARGGTVGPVTVGGAMGTQTVGSMTYTNSM